MIAGGLGGLLPDHHDLDLILQRQLGDHVGRSRVRPGRRIQAVAEARHENDVEVGIGLPLDIVEDDLAVQPQKEASLTVEETTAQFPILADSEHAVASEYGVYHLFYDSEAAPSVFIISQDGQIVWDSIATAISLERVPSQTILENLQ